MEVISKAKIKWIRSLQLKKTRELEGVFVVEGEKMVLEGLTTATSEVVCIVVHKNALDLVQDFQDAPLFSAGNTEMEQLSTLKTPNKLVAVFKRKEHPISNQGFKLVLDTIQDPGNMGTIMRLADWFGIQQIICSNETVDCYNSKVIQASMGAVFRVGVTYTDLNTYLSAVNVPIYGALLNGENYHSVDYHPDGILLMGNEGNGISEQLLQYVQHAVTIPRIGQAESLNVATATAILLAEIRK